MWRWSTSSRPRNTCRSASGGGYIVPLLGAWERFDDIDFDALPDRFALKCTHDCGSIVLCTDKRSFDRAAAKRKLERALHTPYAELSREWAYRNVPPRIIAEKFLDGGEQGVLDCKVFCFNGEPRIVRLCVDRFSAKGLALAHYTMDWKRKRVHQDHYPDAEGDYAPPEELPEILSIAKVLSRGLPFVRVDTSVVNHKVYFGELTLYPGGGFMKYTPESFDRELGDMLTLPEKRTE